jgi:hypothetical protein
MEHNLIHPELKGVPLNTSREREHLRRLISSARMDVKKLLQAFRFLSAWAECGFE